jgi:hypothetical protein
VFPAPIRSVVIEESVDAVDGCVMAPGDGLEQLERISRREEHELVLRP